MSGQLSSFFIQSSLCFEDSTQELRVNKLLCSWRLWVCIYTHVYVCVGRGRQTQERWGKG